MNRDELQYTAELAMLKLSEEDIETLDREISALLNYCAIVQSADVDRFETDKQDTATAEVLREDRVRPFPQTLADKAEEHDDGFIVVPSVF